MSFFKCIFIFQVFANKENHEKLQPQNHLYGNSHSDCSGQLEYKRCVSTKNISSPSQPPNSSLACSQNSRARELANWARHLAKIRTHSPKNQMIFFRQKLALGRAARRRARRRPRIRHAAFSSIYPRVYYAYETNFV